MTLTDQKPDPKDLRAIMQQNEQLKVLLAHLTIRLGGDVSVKAIDLAKAAVVDCRTVNEGPLRGYRLTATFL